MVCKFKGGGVKASDVAMLTVCGGGVKADDVLSAEVRMLTVGEVR